MALSDNSDHVRKKFEFSFDMIYESALLKIHEPGDIRMILIRRCM